MNRRYRFYRAHCVLRVPQADFSFFVARQAMATEQTRLLPLRKQDSTHLLFQKDRSTAGHSLVFNSEIRPRFSHFFRCVALKPRDVAFVHGRNYYFLDVYYWLAFFSVCFLAGFLACLCFVGVLFVVLVFPSRVCCAG